MPWTTMNWGRGRATEKQLKRQSMISHIRQISEGGTLCGEPKRRRDRAYCVADMRRIVGHVSCLACDRIYDAIEAFGRLQSNDERRRVRRQAIMLTARTSDEDKATHAAITEIERGRP